MKIVGVPPDAIGRIHEILSKPICKTKENIHLRQGISGLNGGKLEGQFEYVTIEESKLDSEHNTYTVMLKVHLRFLIIEGEDEYFQYQPFKVLSSVLQTIDPNLMQDEERRVPLTHTARRLRLDNLKTRKKAVWKELQEKIRTLLGKKPSRDISDSDGSPILAAGDVFSNEHGHVWHAFTYGVLDLQIPACSDPFMKVLCEAQEIAKIEKNLEEEIART